MIKREEATNPKSCLNQSQDDEMLFVLCARDPMAPDLVERWASQAERHGTAGAKIAEARACAEAMRAWKKRDDQNRSIEVAQTNLGLPILQFFVYAHLTSPPLRETSRLFADLAQQLAVMTPEEIDAEIALCRASQASSTFSRLCAQIDSTTPANPEATRAVVKIIEAVEMLCGGKTLETVLIRLLEAKDCAVRAHLYKG